MTDDCGWRIADLPARIIRAMRAAEWARRGASDDVEFCRGHERSGPGNLLFIRNALMFQYRFIGPIIVLALGLTGPALIGQSQPATTPPPIGPFDSLHFRPLGPASMSGRISDVAVYEANPAIFYVGTAHGGVWKTTNNGTTFEPQFQDYGLMSIGDIAVAQNNPDL